jgi:hypothetical protein
MTAVTASTDDGQISECSPPPHTGSKRPQRGYASGKEDYLRRLRKIEGQVRGLQKMIEADTWCPDVVLQVGSATGPSRKWPSGCSMIICVTVS